MGGVQFVKGPLAPFTTKVQFLWKFTWQIDWGPIRFLAFEGFEGFKMDNATRKLWLRRILWMFPFVSTLIYCIPIFIAEVSRHQVFYDNYNQVVEDDIPSKIQMPAISICSSNQYSYRDADNILKIPKWYEINYNYTKFMSIFRNFAHHKMDPNEIDAFTQDQKNFLIEHRKAFTELLRKQVIHVFILKLSIGCLMIP